jgi:putative oxidoreductase
MNSIPLIGRILFSIIFIFAGFKHFSHDMIQNAANQNVPLPSLLVPLSGIMSLLGGLSILLGYKARYGAWLLILFLIPVTVMMHPFWKMTDPHAAMIQQIMFFKNLAILGGAFLIAYFGSGPLSIDHKSAKIYPFKKG